MKRKLTLFLSAVMATSCLPMTAYAANFKDINEQPWASVSINNAADRGLVSGYDENGARYYKPKNNVTYCEAMQMVYNVLQKTGAARYMEATKTYAYMQTLTTLRVPKWAQIATAYGLENGLVSLETVAAKFKDGTQLATREDVARMLGNGLNIRYSFERKPSLAADFNDYWRISDEAAAQVELLKRLDIITGTNGNFLPKNNITRAEMAVMLNNTYEVLTEGVTESGEITAITNNEGAFYRIEVKLEDGQKTTYYANADMPVYEGKTESRLPISRLSKGDSVELVINGDSLVAIRQLSGVEAQAKYDVTGYLDTLKNGLVELENENTGEHDEYRMDSDTLFYLDGVKINRRDLEKKLEENYKEHVYTGVMTEVRRERNSSTKQYEDITYAVEVHLTFTEEYTMTGEVKKLSNTQINVKQDGSSAERNFILADSCKIYIGDEEVTMAKAKALVEDGTTYAKVTVDMAGDAIKIILAEDTFEGTVEKADVTTYKVSAFSEKKMILETNSKETTYLFGSTNPVDNIAFYVWDEEHEEWNDVEVLKAEEEFDKWDDAKKTVYARIETNKGGKLTEVFLSNKRSAWTTTEQQTERKGTVVSLEDGILKFKTSSVEYKMLNAYNQKPSSNDDSTEITGSVHDKDDEVANPLNNVSAATSSLKVFEKMANDDSLELYAEIVADYNNKVLKVDARLKSAVGELVSYDKSGKVIEIETEDGNTFKIRTVNTPKTDDEDSYKAEDLSSTTYTGSMVTLEFNNNGLVSKINLDTNTSGRYLNNAEGFVESVTDKTLKLKGLDETFTWLPESKTEYRNFSMASTSWYKLKNEILADDALEVYVELQLSDTNKIERIDLYVKGAEGTLESYNSDKDTVRILTENGNQFTFDVKGKPTVDFNDLTAEDLENGKGNGKAVTLKFGSDNRVEAIVKG